MSSLFSERSHTVLADLLTCRIVRRTGNRDIMGSSYHDDSSLLRRLTATIVQQLDRSLARLTSAPLDPATLGRMRWFWLDSLFANISVGFFAT